MQPIPSRARGNSESSASRVIDRLARNGRVSLRDTIRGFAEKIVDDTRGFDY